jgi:lysozyme
MPSLRAKIIALVVSATGLTTLVNYEGIRERAYRNFPKEPATIGVGSTKYEDGSPVKMGDTITRQEAVTLFKNTLSIYEADVKRCVKVPLYQYEYDAYVSLTYNIGGGRFCKSLIPVKLAAFDYAGACKEILRYNQAGGVYLRGLDIRRKEEYQTCIGAKEKKESAVTPSASKQNTPDVLAPAEKPTDKLSTKAK